VSDAPVAARIEILPARSADEIATVKKLFLEYANSLGVSLCFQGFDEELAELPGAYAPPKGRLYLVHVDGTAAGCVGLRPLDSGSDQHNFDGADLDQNMWERAVKTALRSRYVVQEKTAAVKATAPRRPQEAAATTSWAARKANT
jgi:hypothetical protein